ncbi:hypothetical protein AC579_7809 [Pseudocercospora musae]|uniref:DUF7908 domain-containing protein n=1 Tax=Pseudocercospora musae TaxID=113226 RepID=A0A139IJ91_9PEZI|nr:hypothetical protein AC579_7809 [Pseudocercospora musae]KXT14760.1 hypothetical protein AC579_7809 [Pseudocercospora musae]
MENLATPRCLRTKLSLHNHELQSFVFAAIIHHYLEIVSTQQSCRIDQSQCIPAVVLGDGGVALAGAMHYNKAAFGLAIAALPFGVLSELVTVTEYPSACSAIYTSKSGSSTLMVSTVTVSPTPFSDASINSGATFAVEIQPMGQAAKKRQAESRTYLNAGGYTTTDPSQAVQYSINDGVLSATTGGSVTADQNDTSVPFAVSTTLKSIRTRFFSQNLTLGWNDTAFEGGAAEFYMTPAFNGSQQVFAYLKGAHVANWMPVSFALRPAGGLVIESSTSIGATSVSASVSMEDPSASATATAESSIIPPGVSAGSSTAASVSATPSSNVSPEGLCGANTGFNCYGAPDGNCCSQYGFCGGNTDRDQYCGQGCQSAYGECDTPSAASSSVDVIPTPSSGSLMWSSSVVTSSGGAVNSSSIAIPSGGYNNVTMSSAASSSLALSTAVSPTLVLTTSNGVTWTSTPSPASSAIPSSGNTLPTISDAATPIGPGGPDVTLTPSSTASPALSETPSFSFIESSPIPFDSSSIWSSSASSAESSISRAASSIQSQISSISSSAASSSSSAVSSASSAASSLSSAASSVIVPASSAAETSSAAATNTGSAFCPAADDTIRTYDGEQYTIGCGSDTTGIGVGSYYATSSSYEECFAVCQSYSGCQGLTWSGANGAQYGIGSGNCYFKGIGVDGQPIQFSGSGDNPSLVAAIKVIQEEPASSSAPVSSAPATSSDVAVSSPAETSSIMMASSSSTTSLFVYSESSVPGRESSSAPFTSPPPVSLPSPLSVSTPSSSSAAGITSSISSTSAPSATSSPSSSSSNYLVLPSPTACNFGDPADWPEDDSYCLIALPTPMVIYGNSDTQTFAATNGYISLGQGSQAYEAERLPSIHVPPATIAPFFDDLAVFGGQTPMQGIFYQLFDDGVTYEYYLFRSGVAGELYHFTVEYKYATPGVFVYTYYNVGNGNNGQFASVGMQGNQGSASGTLVGFQYSYETTNITPGLVVTCNSTENICAANAAGEYQR